MPPTTITHQVEKPFRLLYIRSGEKQGVAGSCHDPFAFNTRVEAEEEAAKRIRNHYPGAAYLIVEVLSEVTFIPATEAHVQIARRKE